MGESQMAIAAYEDRLPETRLPAELPPIIGIKKLAIWIIAATLPWAAIIGTVKLALAAIG
jgi:hypothetical protein